MKEIHSTFTEQALYLSKSWNNLFVQNLKYICSKLEIYLFKSINPFYSYRKRLRYTCPNFRIYFFQHLKFISSNCYCIIVFGNQAIEEILLLQTKYERGYVKILKCICTNLEIYLSKVVQIGHIPSVKFQFCGNSTFHRVGCLHFFSFCSVAKKNNMAYIDLNAYKQ